MRQCQAPLSCLRVVTLCRELQSVRIMNEYSAGFLRLAMLS
jgi:hypothetical protein